MTEHKNLIKILTKYPNLPIIANVYSEVVADDGCVYWYGDVEESCYTDTLWAGNEKTWSLKEALDDVLYFMDWEFPEKDTEKMTLNEIKSFIQSLPWKKYIVLNVTTPDSLQGDEENEYV